jgi:hypothetical protein
LFFASLHPGVVVAAKAKLINKQAIAKLRMNLAIFVEQSCKEQQATAKGCSAADSFSAAKSSHNGVAPFHGQLIEKQSIIWRAK